MASNMSLKTQVMFTLALSLALFVQATLGGITCENLEHDTCAFAVSSSGKRCVLEKHVKRSGEEAYTCRTSEIEADKLKELIETDQCIKACGLDRKTLGISSDSLLDSRFTQNLCSPQCYESCPNIVDLYFNLAAGEGVFLPKLCKAQTNPRRAMSEIRSSGYVAPGPVLPAMTFMDFGNDVYVAPGPVLPAMSEIRSSGYVAPGPVLPAMSEIRSSGYLAPGPVLPAMTFMDFAPLAAPALAPY